MDKEGVMIYLTSDHHFGHTNIIRFCNRPFMNVHEMNKILTENWNQVIGKDDEVYYLGDFSWGEATRYLGFLNGKITWIRGNHDRNSNIRGVYAKYKINIVQRLELKYKGYTFLLHHKPFIDDDTNIDWTNIDWVLCGHVHEKWKIYQKNINVGVDVWDFKPVHIDKLISLIKQIESETRFCNI